MRSGTIMRSLVCIQRQADQKPIAAPTISKLPEKKTFVCKVRSSQRPANRASSIGIVIVQPRMPIWPSRAPSEGSGISRPRASRSTACRATLAKGRRCSQIGSTPFAQRHDAASSSSVMFGTWISPA